MARRSYLAVLASAVACYAALGAVLRLLPTLTDDRALLGLLVGAPALTAVITRPAGGRLAGRVGPAPVILGGGVGVAGGRRPRRARGGDAGRRGGDGGRRRAGARLARDRPAAGVATGGRRGRGRDDE